MTETKLDISFPHPTEWKPLGQSGLMIGSQNIDDQTHWVRIKKETTGERVAFLHTRNGIIQTPYGTFTITLRPRAKYFNGQTWPPILIVKGTLVPLSDQEEDQEITGSNT